MQTAELIFEVSRTFDACAVFSGCLLLWPHCDGWSSLLAPSVAVETIRRSSIDLYSSMGFQHQRSTFTKASDNTKGFLAVIMLDGQSSTCVYQVQSGFECNSALHSVAFILV